MKNKLSNLTTITLALSTIVSIIAIPETVKAAQLYGIINTDNSLVTFDSSNPNTVEVIGSTNIQEWVSGLSFNDAGQLFAFSQGFDSFSFYSIDVSTGESTLIGSNNITGFFPTDLAWNPSESRMEVFAFTDLKPQVYQVELNTGELSLLGNIPGIIDQDGAAFARDLDGTSYYFSDLSDPDRWVQVSSDLSTVKLLNPVSFDATLQEQGAAIDWNRDGTLYHATSSFLNSGTNDFGELYTIDKENGDSTLVGLIGTNIDSNGVQIGDIAINPTSVPEPTSVLCLFALGIFGAGDKLGKKRRI